ncbi:MAG: hypothetical protein LUB59_01235 [Candidatus Gastranaerophilales bacterium]|nr:hypothetical protein [Candidatus Gastranaerophilales bacterium]
MIKYIKLLVLFLLLLVCTSGCKDKEKPGILFSKEPITIHNVMNASRNFEVGQKIYYLFYTPDKIKSEFIRVQVFKAGDNVPRGGYSIVWTGDYRIMKQNMYYYYNNFVLHSAGRYVMQVFDVDNLGQPLAWNFFYVK